MYPQLLAFITSLDVDTISLTRKEILAPIIAYVQSKREAAETPQLNFICTHNSRRSQLSQVWAKTLAAHYQIPIASYSGGVEVTAFHPNAVSCLERAGFSIEKPKGENPVYRLFYTEDQEPILAFSKMYDDATNPDKQFAALMTCSHADENCPFIIGAEKRIPMTYEDPKIADGTPAESETYDLRSQQIATEMKYIFSSVH